MYKLPASLLLAASMSASPSAIAAQNLEVGSNVLSLSAPQASSKDSAGVINVDFYDVFLLDVSGSMDPLDIDASMQGIINYHLSDEALADYQAGICTATQIVYYAADSYSLDNQIICSEEDLTRFVNAMRDVNMGVVRASVGSDTNLVQAMRYALATFMAEVPEGVSAGNHRVVIVGDELGGNVNDLRDISLHLTSQFGATVNSISINNAGLATIFRNNVSTSEDFARGHFVRAGVTRSAATPQEVQNSLEEILSLTKG